jgi:hypothetical protein
MGLLTSCVNLDRLFNTGYETKNLDIPVSIESIEFQDKRDYVSPGPDIRLPVFSLPGQFVDYYPEFSQAHKRLVADIIHKNFRSNNATAFKANVELIQGAKEFSATFSKETETVIVRLRITLQNEKEKYITETNGQWFVSSADAKYKRFEELYQRAIQSVAFAGLQELKSKYLSQ